MYYFKKHSRFVTVGLLLQITSLRENCRFPRPKINGYINKHTLATPRIGILRDIPKFT